MFDKKLQQKQESHIKLIELLYPEWVELHITLLNPVV
jgi:hypothetical protein